MLITPIPTREVCKLLKTGQVTSYVDYDDAYYANLGLGIDKEYLILTDDQFDGTTDITLNEKTDVHSNHCVLDLKTGLMWSRDASASVGPDSDGKLPWTTNGSGEGIFPYVAAANAAGLAGYADWRVCNRRELESLLNDENAASGADSIAFPNWPPNANGIIWASTTVKNNTVNAFCYDYQGAISQYSKTNKQFCLLVRGG